MKDLSKENTPNKEISRFEKILPLFDKTKNDYSKTKPYAEYEIRKVFARVLLSNNLEIFKEARIAVDWLNNNKEMYQIYESEIED
jgi:hypothetical protein